MQCQLRTSNISPPPDALLFSMQVTYLSDDVVEFDLVGVDPAIANALRRIMISEIPTIAIENVYFVNNTSIIQASPCLPPLAFAITSRRESPLRQRGR